MIKDAEQKRIFVTCKQCHDGKLNTGLKIGGRMVASGELKLTRSTKSWVWMPDVWLCYRISKSCNVNYAKYKVKNKTQYVV